MTGQRYLDRRDEALNDLDCVRGHYEAAHADIVHAITMARDAADALADLTTDQFQHCGDRDVRGMLVTFLQRMGHATDDERREYRAELEAARLMGVDIGDRDPGDIAEELAELHDNERDEAAAALERVADCLLHLQQLPAAGETVDSAVIRLLRNAYEADPGCNCGVPAGTPALSHGQFCRVYIHATTVRAIR